MPALRGLPYGNFKYHRSCYWRNKQCRCSVDKPVLCRTPRFLYLCMSVDLRRWLMSMYRGRCRICCLLENRSHFSDIPAPAPKLHWTSGCYVAPRKYLVLINISPCNCYGRNICTVFRGMLHTVMNDTGTPCVLWSWFCSCNELLHLDLNDKLCFKWQWRILYLKSTYNLQYVKMPIKSVIANVRKFNTEFHDMRWII
jgi:hypothetical protein